MGSMLGTPQFMSPEQAAGRLDLISPASDIYSLGATLYGLLTGQAPFHSADLAQTLQRVQSGVFPRPRQVRRDVPPPLEAICLKAMALAPRDRYRTASELADDLDRWAEQGVGGWRAALERFAEDRAPVHFRPNAEASAALRALAASGRRLGVYTDAPAELATVALAHLGAGRRVELVETGAGARERLLAGLGPDTTVAASREDLVRISESGGEES